MSLSRFIYKLVYDFWQLAFFTWLVLVIFELLRSGAVQRFINLEYWFYTLIFIYIILRFLKR